VTFPAPLYQQLQWVVLHEVRQAREEQSRVCAVNVAVVARDGHRHLLHRAEAAKAMDEKRSTWSRAQEQEEAASQSVDDGTGKRRLNSSTALVGTRDART